MPGQAGAVSNEEGQRMSDETTNETTPEAPAEAPKETRGLFGRKRKKMTMKEQIQEIMPLIYVLIIGGIGYGL